MKRLQITSLIILIVGIISLIMWRFMLPVPDWFVKGTGIILLIAIFVFAFSSVRLYNKNRDIK